MQPGIYRNLPNADYHGGPGDSKSGLDLVRKSPAHLKAARNNPEARRPTPSQILGTALHALVLEPHVFAESYALPFQAPAGALSTVDDMKAALEAGAIDFKASAKKSALEDLVRASLPDAVLLSDARAAYEAENKGRDILAPESWDQLHNMRDAVMAHNAARKLITAPGEAELSAYWTEDVLHPVTGELIFDRGREPARMLLRVRPDYWRHDGIIVDLKSCQPGGAAPEEFARSIAKWRYYVQHPMYLHGARAALEAAKASGSDEFSAFSEPRAFVFIAVENDACVVDGVAKGVAVYTLQPDSVQLGAAEMREDIHTLHQCVASGRFPGYSEAVQPLELPAYTFTKAAARAPHHED